MWREIGGWRERDRKRKKDIEIFHPLVHSLYFCHSWGGARQKSETSSESPIWQQGPKQLGSSPTTFPVHLQGVGSEVEQLELILECQCHRWQLYLQWYNASPLNCLSLKTLFLFNWKVEGQGEREGEIKIFYSLVHSPKGCNDQVGLGGRQELRTASVWPTRMTGSTYQGHHPLLSQKY